VFFYPLLQLFFFVDNLSAGLRGERAGEFFLVLWVAGLDVIIGNGLNELALVGRQLPSVSSFAAFWPQKIRNFPHIRSNSSEKSTRFNAGRINSIREALAQFVIVYFLG
jgi:hypothetical protein